MAGRKNAKDRDGWSGMSAAEKLEEAKRARNRMVNRMVELKRRGAPEGMQLRLKLDFKDVLEVINDLNARLQC